MKKFKLKRKNYLIYERLNTCAAILNKTDSRSKIGGKKLLSIRKLLILLLTFLALPTVVSAEL